MKVAIKTYGCTLNRADSLKMRAILESKGHEIVNEDEAEVIVVNTCTVKAATEQKIRHYLKSLKKKGKRFVVAGCLAAVDRGLAEEFNTVIINPYSIKHVEEAIYHAKEGKSKVIFHFENKDGLPIKSEGLIHSIGIQEGCTSKCAFCQTKLARPKLQSRSIESIIEEIRYAVSKGAVEIDLAGTDTGAYGIDKGYSLVDLLKAVNDIKGTFMARLGMANPQHIKRLGRALMEEMSKQNIYSFLHTSVQTGSEKVAEDMRRDHTVKDFIEIVEAYREKFGADNITIETDIIVGYPTEGEEDFQATLKLIERTKPDVINLSKFTPRKGTDAATLKQLPSEVIKRRSVEAAQLIKELHLKMNSRWIGREVRALITEERKGRLPSYKQVVIKDWDKRYLGKWISCTVDDATHTSLICIKTSPAGRGEGML